MPRISVFREHPSNIPKNPAAFTLDYWIDLAKKLEDNCHQQDDYTAAGILISIQHIKRLIEQASRSSDDEYFRLRQSIENQAFKIRDAINQWELDREHIIPTRRRD